MVLWSIIFPAGFPVQALAELPPSVSTSILTHKAGPKLVVNDHFLAGRYRKTIEELNRLAPTLAAGSEKALSYYWRGLRVRLPIQTNGPSLLRSTRGFGYCSYRFPPGQTYLPRRFSAGSEAF